MCTSVRVLNFRENYWRVVSYSNGSKRVSMYRVSLGPRPKPTPAWVASSRDMEAIRTGVGLGLGPRLGCISV